MYPFFHIGVFKIPAYSTVIILGFLISMVFLFPRCRLYHIKKEFMLYAVCFSVIGLLLGAKIMYAISLIPSFVRHWDYFSQHVSQMIYLASLGLVFYGGLIGALLCLYACCRLFHLPFLALTNIAVPIIPFVHSFGRIGCFLGGCCYGIEYHGFGSVTFPDTELIQGVGNVPRFPVQILESALNMILFFCLYFYSRKHRKPGSVLGIYLICYAILRFFLEFLRGDIDRGIVLGISTSQWISVPLLLFGLFLLFFQQPEKQNK